MNDKKIMIYGANGYTGRLLTKHLLKTGLRPILAARSNKIEAIGKELNCPTKIFSIENAAADLDDIDFFVNLAGPFSITQDKLIQACVKSKTNYLDIAGEYDEVKNAFKYNDESSEAGIAILPAAGFGVVPTDIAAKIACENMTNPISLKIIYATVGGASRGTLKTVLKDIQKNGHILVNGKYQVAKPAQSEITVDVFSKRFKAVYNPWRADLFSAYKSTGVPNIETYSEFPGFVVSMMKGKLNWLKNLILNRLINFLPEGPSDKQLAKGSTYIKAIAKNSKGDESIVEMKGPEAYLFTALSIQKMMQLVLSKHAKGCITPSDLGVNWVYDLKEIQIKSIAG